MSGAGPSGPGEPGAGRREMLVQMTALGLEFSGSVLGGLALGWFLDEWLGTSPWMVLVMTLAGMAAAVARLVVLTRRFDEMRRRRERGR